MPDDLEQVAPSTTKDEQITGVRVAVQGFLNLQCQSVHASPHVGPADRQPDPRAQWYRDHGRASALTIAAAKSGEADVGILTREPSRDATSIVSAAGAATS